MTQPGAIGSAMPADEATTQRRLADLERQVRELGPSIAESFNSTVAKVVSFDSIGVSASGFPLSASQDIRVSGSITVPDGFTSVTVLAIANASAYNTTTGMAYTLVRAVINGVAGGASSQAVDAGQQGHVSASAIRTRSVAGGDEVTVGATVYSDRVWPAVAQTICNIDAILLFRRA